jgi:thioester reductase-like protein
MNKRNIFITGATGFLASNLLRVLLAKKENHLYILVRAKGNRSLLQCKNALINKTFPKSMCRKTASRIDVVGGDISSDNLGLSKKDLDKLRLIHAVYHCAAICKFSHNLSDIRKVNVRGTENVLKLALDWQNAGYLENVNHISTAYIAGNYKGAFYEEETDVSQGFNNSYEQSKFEAELAVLKYRKKGLPVDIYRPSIITNAIPPCTDTIPGLLRILVMFISEIFEKIPADNDARLNLIPVDVVSKAIYLISTTKNRPHNQNYHIVNPRSARLGTLLNTSSNFFIFKKPKCIPVSSFHMGDLSPIQRKIIKPFIPYLNQKLSLNMKNAASALKRYNFTIPSITKKELIKTFKYYRSSGLIREKGSCTAMKK